MNYLTDEDGNPETYKDGTPIPDLDPGHGINHNDPMQTATVKAVGKNGEDFGVVSWINEEYAKGYIDQQQHFFPDSGTVFTIKRPYRPAGSNIVVL